MLATIFMESVFVLLLLFNDRLLPVEFYCRRPCYTASKASPLSTDIAAAG